MYTYRHTGTPAHIVQKERKLCVFSAFTLVEVLIVLMVIGIIAILTIAILIKTMDNTETRQRLQKAYASLSQAHRSIISENNGSFVGLCSSSDCIKDLFKAKMNVIKDCPAASSRGACLPLLYYHMSKSFPTANAVDRDSLVLSDGTSVAFWSGGVDSTCADYRAVLNGANASCGIIQVDVNGLKSPNKTGEDIYLFFILKDRVLPIGGTYSVATYQVCNESVAATTAGNGCAYVVLNGGWHL